jgi:PAS domain S-box-containing protein
MVARIHGTSAWSVLERTVHLWYVMRLQESKRGACMGVSDGLARQLLNAAPDPSIVINSDGTILHTNARVNDVFGYRQEELIGQHMEVLLPERYRKLHPQHRIGFFKNPSPRPMGSGLELYVRCKGGSELPVEISLSPVSTPEGPLVYAAIRDVSTQKELQRQLRDASRAKRRFLAAASHDLRQPIQALTLLNSVAKKSATDPIHQSIIAKQQKSLDSMAGLLNALLDISKLEAGIVKPDITDCAVQQIFDDLRAGYEEQARFKGLDLIIEPCGDVARSDYRLLTQILENFISNAIRYTKNGYVRLRCHHRAAHIQLEVLDTGLGISPDEIGNIFDEFHQADAGKTRPDGLGLGLSIVKRTAELLGCKLSVRSKPGEGSVFSVEVPQGSRVEMKQDASNQRSESPVATGTILIVDDEPAILDATALLLEMEGFEVLTAACEDDALKELSSRAPDLLITDYHLRDGATGAELIRSIRKRLGDSLPVILVSGDTSDAIVVKDLEGARFLTKPVDTDELLDEIQKKLGR